jgi:hypothetical protein
MATLSEITKAHSQRINALTRTREDGLRRANTERDDKGRAIPAAALLYAKFDEQVGDARARQVATDSRAEEARSAALQKSGDERAVGLDAAHRRRRDADVAAFEQRRKAEEAAEKKFMDSVAANPNRPSVDARRQRAAEMDKAKADFDEALRAAQERFRTESDAAIVEERRDARDADRAFQDAIRIGESGARAARTAAEQALSKGLSLLPEAAGVFEQWRKATARVVADYKRGEDEEMARFHDEMQQLRA